MIAALLSARSCLLASASVCVSVCVFTLLSVGVCFFSVFCEDVNGCGPRAHMDTPFGARQALYLLSGMLGSVGMEGRLERRRGEQGRDG